MKKVITIAICICLVFSSISNTYAAETITYFMDGNSSTRISAYTVMTNIRDSCAALMAYVISFNNDFNNWIDLDASGNTLLTYYSWGEVSKFIYDIKLDTVSSLQNPTGHSSKGLLEMIWAYVGSMDTTLNYTSQDVNSILSEAGLIDYYTQANNTKLINVDQDLEKYFGWKPAFTSYNEGRDWYQDYYIIDSDNGVWGDISTERDKYTSDISKTDFIIRLLQTLNFNQAKEYNQFMTDVDATLSIWDSQGDSLTQSTWTPSSAMNGLYKYLAYTQRDVARLTHVLASDYEIEARDNVQDLQESFNDQFLDPDSDGAISTDDVEDISGLSGGIKENLSTNANASGIFDIFNSNHGGWFSQETANELDTSTPQNRGDRNANSTYPTPLLDERINEIYNALGVNNND